MDAPSLVSAWDALVQQLCPVFTAPTGRTWSQIALGWVLNRGPATVTAIFRTLGNTADWHWTVYKRFTRSMATLDMFLGDWYNTMCILTRMEARRGGVVSRVHNV